MGIRASLVAAGAPIAWVESFQPEVVDTFREELREAIRLVKASDFSTLQASESDFAVALAWYFLTEGWEVKFVHEAGGHRAHPPKGTLYNSESRPGGREGANQSSSSLYKEREQSCNAGVA